VCGFDKVLWDSSLPAGVNGSSVELRYVSRDGEENYPGTLSVSVVYELTDDNELIISYRADTDKPTIINLTNHTYFNLSAGESETILDHEMELHAGHYTPVDGNLIPTGEIESVEDTALDFRNIKPIGVDLGNVEGGYDHNFVLSKDAEYDVRAVSPISGRVLEMRTTEPGVQFYTGNFLDGIKGRDGAIYNKHAGFCLEAQHYPDSPNKPQFPTVVLRPGETYTQKTEYRFLVDA
jgi:aldose 1-epimerase